MIRDQTQIIKLLTERLRRQERVLGSILMVYPYMKGLLCLLILSAPSAIFAQHPVPSAQPPEPYQIQNDVLGEPISVYRKNNPECSDKDPVTESANFYQAKTPGKWGGTCAALSFDPNLLHGKSTRITYADTPMKMKVASFSEDRWVLLIFTAKHPDYDVVRTP